MDYKTSVPKDFQFKAHGKKVHPGVPEDYTPKLKAPLCPGDEGWDEMWNDSLEVAEYAKESHLLHRMQPGLIEIFDKYYKSSTGMGKDELRDLLDGDSELPNEPWTAAARILDHWGLNFNSVTLYNENDLPQDTMGYSLRWLLGRGVPLKNPSEFLDVVVELPLEFLMLLKRRCPEMFYEKWFWKMCRPQELAKVLGVPMKGCLYLHPNHPAYGAKHFFVSTLNRIFLFEKFDFSNHPLEKELLSMLSFEQPFGRTGAIVHYIDDNLAGGALAGDDCYAEYLMAV